MKDFFRAALIRMGHTMAQTAIAAIGTSAVILSEINWGHMISAVALAGLLSFLKSVVIGLPELEKEIEDE